MFLRFDLLPNLMTMEMSMRSDWIGKGAIANRYLEIFESGSLSVTTGHNA